MKTLRLFFATMLVLFLAVGVSGAQGNKTVTTGSFSDGGILVCTDDYAAGEVSWVITNWDGKGQIRYIGTYTGESGKIYTWNLVENFNWKIYMEGRAFNRTRVLTSVVECDGVPIAILKIRYHLTENASGEISVVKMNDNIHWECL